MKLKLPKRFSNAERDQRVLDAIKAGHCYGLDIAKAADVGAGTVYPSLFRLERDGQIWSSWAELEEGKDHRRRLYRAVVG